LFFTVWLTICAVYSLAFAVFLGHPTPDTMKAVNGPRPTVCIVVPTYNEASIIDRKLENILQLNYPRNKLRVMVVDSASIDETRSIVKEFANRHKNQLAVALLEQPVRMGKSQAINEALRVSDAEIFGLTDADVIVPPEALLKLVQNFQDSSMGGASGFEVPLADESFLSSLEAGYRAVYTAIRKAEASVDTPLMCESEFSLYRRDALGPLRPGCMCDDLELTVMVRSKGLRCMYDLEVPFYEREASSLKPKFSHKLRRSTANQHAIFRSLAVFFNRSFGKYGSLVFPFELFANIISPVLVTTALAFFVGIVITEPGDALPVLAYAALVGLPGVVLLRVLTNRYGSPEISMMQRSLSWVLGVAAFLGFQIALVASLVRLGLGGPQLMWEQVPGTRTSAVKTVELKLEEAE